MPTSSVTDQLLMRAYDALRSHERGASLAEGQVMALEALGLLDGKLGITQDGEELLILGPTFLLSFWRE